MLCCSRNYQKNFDENLKKRFVNTYKFSNHDNNKLICCALRDLVPFKKCEKHPWRSVTFSKVAGLLKVALLHLCFSCFLNCAHGTESHNALHFIVATRYLPI